MMPRSTTFIRRAGGPLPRSIAPMRQRGFVLILVLVFLVAFTLMALSSLRSVSAEEHMSAGFQDHSRAFAAAELGLRYAERVLTESSPVFSNNCANGLCSSGSAPDWSTYAWNASKSGTYGGAAGVSATTVAGLANPPQYFIESKGAVPVGGGGSCDYYAITAKGWGGAASSSTVLREVVRQC